jgi:hypothetical protein
MAVQTVLKSKPLQFQQWLRKFYKPEDDPPRFVLVEDIGFYSKWTIDGLTFTANDNKIDVEVDEPTQVMPKELEQLIRGYERYLGRWVNAEEQEVTIELQAKY